MAIEITVPRLGWSMEEGTFLGWLKKDGEAVKTGEPLFTLETEKASQDIEATDNGVLRIPTDAVQTGAVVKVGLVLGHLVAENEVEITPPAKASEEKQHSSTDLLQDNVVIPPDVSLVVKNEHSQKEAKSSSSPRARRRAKELGVDLSRLIGSGRTGRVIESDVFKAASNDSSKCRDGDGALSNASQISTMRRSIAERTALSFSTIPHFYLRAEVDVTELVKMREHLLELVETELGVRITLTDFLLRAQALALRDFPAMNAVWRENSIVQYRDADIGLVVGLPDGLVIPVLRAAQRLSLVQLAKERVRLIETVKGGRFGADIAAGGATSISNLGTTRMDEFTAIIAPHQSSMLAVGRAVARPYVVESRVEIRTTLWLCLSIDHRVSDGMPAAQFLQRIVEMLESPKTLVDGAVIL
jgi:pyruvate dehydrogenase E2 component (dihydrolipoamide acetyltransferase)